MASLWWRAPVLGAALGLPILGLGGRLAMRIISHATGAPAASSAEGTLTVVMAGIASGIGSALVYALLAWRIPHRRGVRAVLFAAFLCFITIRGLHPVTPLPLALFGPLVVLYGVLLERVWHRRPHLTQTPDVLAAL